MEVFINILVVAILAMLVSLLLVNYFGGYISEEKKNRNHFLPFQKTGVREKMTNPKTESSKKNTYL
jgi:hypothetical protein